MCGRRRSLQSWIADRRSLLQIRKNMVSFPKRSVERPREEIAFLPAALEIVETPPSPTRAIV